MPKILVALPDESQKRVPKYFSISGVQLDASRASPIVNGNSSSEMGALGFPLFCLINTIISLFQACSGSIVGTFLGLKAVKSNLKATALNFQAVGVRLESVAANLPAVAANLKAVATNLKAVAANFKATAANLPAVAASLKAVAQRIELGAYFFAKI